MGNKLLAAALVGIGLFLLATTKGVIRLSGRGERQEERDRT